MHQNNYVKTGLDRPILDWISELFYLRDKKCLITVVIINKNKKEEAKIKSYCVFKTG